MTPLIILAVFTVIIALGAMATTPAAKGNRFSSPALQDIVAIPFSYTPQVTVDVTTAGPSVIVPFKCRVIKAQGIVRAAGGTTPHTDVDLVFKNATQTTTIATVPAIDASAIVVGGAFADPVTDAVGEITANDVVRMEIDITGGSSPTADGIMGILWVERY